MSAHERRTHVRDSHDRRASGSVEARLFVDKALARCRAELTLRVASAHNDPDPAQLQRLRAPIADFTRTAAGENIPPERALVMFKKMIGEIADLRGLPPEERDTVQRQLIEIAIESYYAAPGIAARLALLRDDGGPAAPEAR